MRQAFEEEKKEHESKKESIMEYLEGFRQQIILTKSKNMILVNKHEQIMKQYDELDKRRNFVRVKATPGKKKRSLNKSARYSPKLEDSFSDFEDIHKTKPTHRRDQSSILFGKPNQKQMQKVNCKDRSKALKDHLLLQIKLEKNKIFTSEKELEAIKSEEYVFSI